MVCNGRQGYLALCLEVAHIACDIRRKDTDDEIQGVVSKFSRWTSPMHAQSSGRHPSEAGNVHTTRTSGRHPSEAGDVYTQPQTRKTPPETGAWRSRPSKTPQPEVRPLRKREFKANEEQQLITYAEYFEDVKEDCIKVLNKAVNEGMEDCSGLTVPPFRPEGMIPVDVLPTKEDQ